MFQLLADTLKGLEEYDRNLHEEEKKKEPSKDDENKSKKLKMSSENCYQRLVMYCTRQGKSVNARIQ